MKTSEVIETAKRFSKPYRVAEGKKFRLKEVDPKDTGELKSEDKSRAKEALQSGIASAGEFAGCALRAGSLVDAADLPGNGCGGKGWHDQARHVGNKSAGLPGHLVQIPELRRSRSRLSLALCEGAAGARTHRYF